MRWIAIAALAACSAAGAVAADSAPEAAELTAEQIVEKNVAARGGLEAWHKIQTMVWIGHMESPGNPVSQIPFVLQQKRPNKTRFELNAMGQRTLRVFDGKRGWKAHPSQDGRPDVQPFTPQELRFAQGEVVIDSPLFDYESKRVAVELDGIDQVEGRKAYRLIVRTASGQRHNVWIDAQTFLDVKYDRTSYNAAGVPRTVSVFYRDYKTVEGLQIPGTIETGAGPGQGSEKMVIEKIALNPPLDDRVFGKPGGPNRRATVTIEPEQAPATPDLQNLPSNPPAAAPPQAPFEPK
jgi:outer membrane lipoprotein-sorting protein